jgi:integrase
MLTQRKVERLTEAGRYRDNLVAGLYLSVAEGGAKSWLLRYELHGREHMMGLGSAATFSLKEARERARSARQLLAGGIDPLARKRAAKAAAKAEAARHLTFSKAAIGYCAQHEVKWRNKAHRLQFMSSLRFHALQILGDLDVATIDTPDVLRVLDPIWKTKSATAHRVRTRIEAVIDWAVVRGHRPPGTNPAKWKGHLDQVLPAARQVAPVRHFPALPYAELPKFIRELEQFDNNIGAAALRFTILTAARTGEVAGAKWDEIDFDAAVWAVPAERMKAKREHRVPLVPTVIELLRGLPREDGNPFIFIGAKKGAGLSKSPMPDTLRLMGRGAVTVHGFRSTFRDWAAEQTNYPREIAEHALAHSVGDATERAYRRGDALTKRRSLMEAWARYCMSPPVTAADVVPIRGQR